MKSIKIISLPVLAFFLVSAPSWGRLSSDAALYCQENGTELEAGFYVDRRGNCLPISIDRYQGRKLLLSSGGANGEYVCINSICLSPIHCGNKLLILSPTSFVGVFKDEAKCDFFKN